MARSGCCEEALSDRDWNEGIAPYCTMPLRTSEPRDGGYGRCFFSSVKQYSCVFQSRAFISAVTPSLLCRSEKSCRESVKNSFAETSKEAGWNASLLFCISIRNGTRVCSVITIASNDNGVLITKRQTISICSAKDTPYC